MLFVNPPSPPKERLGHSPVECQHEAEREDGQEQEVDVQSDYESNEEQGQEKEDKHSVEEEEN